MASFDRRTINSAERIFWMTAPSAHQATRALGHDLVRGDRKVRPPLGAGVTGIGSRRNG
jgi:hypothetical protein